MRLFWATFFLGSMLLVGFDVAVRRQAQRLPENPITTFDIGPIPTPRP